MTTGLRALTICGFAALLTSCGKPTPLVLEGLDCKTQQECTPMGRAFAQRLQKQYPIGSSQDNLDRDLIAQGFEREHKDITHCTKRGEIGKVGVTQIGCPVFDQNWNPQHALWFWNCGASLLCNRYANVVWSSDEKGRITNLRAGIEVTRGLAGL